mmetsp:Transcript_15683/g.15815  ORF Transcript_15683/g.15815 Transcript_15683/m.15815 type:complete len:691 (-) Transcript_15683:256-2328(-)|eukprot:CAMPEP_0182432602 /NCGR_PEP_ID=MMETSP1167-20130531/57703_1 /TAXON_ID=2988 /ORGANISM="Mallomonas Sp, Strain CCMP3275" /LENGTH=690 /DNA_ID=CAMNT_0024620333 /DNA_START=110 /DNA_END=2182 /DNA_ORIENTATION=+
MEGLNRLSKYFNEKERKRLDSIRENSAFPEMSPDEIKQTCRENDGYECPELNEKLYLHFRGFKKIENLEPYSECRAIWLDSNGFSRIEGLSSLLMLRCLYLGKNLIEKIEGLDSLKQLSILDLSNNRITHIDNLSCCPELQTLNLARNALATADSIDHLAMCNSIINVDITNNNLAGEGIIDVFSRMRTLTALSINGNPITQTSGFRKRTIVAIPKISYLDRPIDALEKITAAAYISGGPEAEKVAREEWREKEKKKKSDEMANFRKWQEEQRTKRTEGGSRVSMLRFTEEEEKQRAEEANRAAEAERRMIGLGVDRLAKKYWQLEGQLPGTQDALAAAAHAVEQEEREREKESSETGDMQSLNLEENKQVEGSVTDTIGSSVECTEESLIDEGRSAEGTKCTEKEGEARETGEIPMMSDKEEQMVAKSIEIEESVDTHHVEEGDEHSDPVDVGRIIECVMQDPIDLLSETEQQRVRDERVQESLRLFYSQQLPAPPSKEALPPPPPLFESNSDSISNTWDDAMKRDNATTEAPVKALRPIYWSEYMDLILAKLVREYAFDFNAISCTMQQIARGRQVGPEDTAANNGSEVDPDLCNAADRLTADECRLRWTQLDAKHWALPHPASSSIDTVFKICVQPSVLGKGHGAQPTFESLAAIAAGSYPAYLTPPTRFPSVSDLAEDDDEDGADE